MKHFIDPKVDCVFKAILGSVKHKKLLRNFLNSIVNFIEPIISVSIENPFNDKQQLDAKLSIVDIKAKDNHGRTYQIEIQLTSPEHLATRMTFNWATLHHRQIIEGDKYQEICPTICIWLLTHDLVTDQDYELKDGQYRYHFEIIDREKDVRLTDHLSIHVIQLNHWHKPERLQAIDYWLYFFTSAHEWKNLPTDAKVPELIEAMKILEKFSDQEESYHAYQSRLAILTEQLSLQAAYEEIERKAAKAQAKLEKTENKLSAVKTKVTEAKAEATEAKAEATEAKAKLKTAQHQKALDIAKKLLATNTMANKQIAEITNLSIEEIERL